MSASLHRYQGALALFLSILVWVYYTIWVILTPFYDNTWFSTLFPQLSYAVQVPVVIGSVFVCSIAYQLGQVVASAPTKSLG
jgi:Dolichol phosphate-mannose biosynthesis regulatory protein (DPM2)